MELKTNISVVIIYLFIQFHIQFTNHTLQIRKPFRRVGPFVSFRASNSQVNFGCKWICPKISNSKFFRKS